MSLYISFFRFIGHHHHWWQCSGNGTTVLVHMLCHMHPILSVHLEVQWEDFHGWRNPDTHFTPGADAKVCQSPGDHFQWLLEKWASDLWGNKHYISSRYQHHYDPHCWRWDWHIASTFWIKKHGVRYKRLISPGLSCSCLAFWMFSLHRSIHSEPRLSGPAGVRQVFLSAVCRLSKPGVHYVAEGWRPDACVWKSAFLPRKRHDDLQSCPAGRWWFIPVCGHRGADPHPVYWLQDASKLWVFDGHPSHLIM